MAIKDTIVNFFTETLKFPHYSKQETDLHNLPDDSQTSKPIHQEFPFANYDPFASYSSAQFNQQQVWSANKNDMIRKWREASYLPEVDTAVSEIANEAIIFDDVEDTIKLNLTDIDLPEPIKAKINESFENILYMLDFNERGDELFKQWYIDGQINIESVFDNTRMRDGIKKLVLLSPFNFNLHEDPETHRKFYYYGETNPNAIGMKRIKKDDVFYEDQITHINSGLFSIDRKFPISYLNKAMKTINQLSLIEDTLVILRISKSTEKRAFYINTGNLPKTKAEEYIRSLINKYRQKRVYNLESGTIENKNKTISILEDFWFPVNGKGEGTKVENIPGVQHTFASFEDVDYFLNKLYKSLNIPMNRRSSDARLTIGNNIDIEKDELKFFKFILKLRRKFNNLFIDLLKKDLLAKHVMKLEDWINIQEKIKFVYANSNEYSEVKNLEILGLRMEGANTASQLVDGGYLSKPYVQKNILRLTDEEITQIDRENASKSEDTEDMGGGLEDMGKHPFGSDYSVRRREEKLDSPKETPENLDVPMEPEVSATPEQEAPK